MFITRRFLPLILSVSYRPEPQLTNEKINTKLTTLQILNAFFSESDTELRAKGFDPKKLHESGKQYLNEHKYFRAKLQYKSMLILEPDQEEAKLYEQSGNALHQHGLEIEALNHWRSAFNHNYRPYQMNVTYAQTALKLGDFNIAQLLFSYQLSKTPQHDFLHNELGVTYFMMATRKNDYVSFAALKKEALFSFDRAAEHSVAKQNHQVVSLLTIDQHYGDSEKNLNLQHGKPTPIIDAMMKDLEAHQNETKSTTAVGLTPTTRPKGGTDLNPTFSWVSYQVGRFPNEYALYQLKRLKEEEFNEEQEKNLSQKHLNR